MREEGPLLESLTRRLTECPAEFLAEPRSQSKGKIRVPAVVYDLLIDLGGEPISKAHAAVFELHHDGSKEARNRLRVILIACWLLHDSWFIHQRRFPSLAYSLLASGLDELATMVDASLFVSDPDRREELARRCMSALGLRPAGESLAQAEDRLATLDSVERSRVIREARAAEERARKIREEMARKAAEEAAATYGRE